LSSAIAAVSAAYNDGYGAQTLRDLVEIVEADRDLIVRT